MTTYPAPGRGAWRITGGLLPAKPKSTTRVGYYRAATAGEDPIGSTWLTKADTTHHAEVVWMGVKAIQGFIGVTEDGWLGPQTAQRIRQVQGRLGVEVDGIIGQATMRALLNEMVADIAGACGVPASILGGILAHESSLDPAAVGVNGRDHGLAQINLDPVFDGSAQLAAAMDPGEAIHWTAENLAHTHANWEDRTSADPWDVAIASHNSPELARRWARSGQPPVVEGRLFQIADYVAAVRTAW
jgi:hypothetical protein